MPRDTLSDLAPFVAGQAVDQVALRARRAQQTQPVGLIGYATKNAPRGTSERRGPTLAELLYAQSTKVNPKAPVIQSIPSTNEDAGWFSARDFPLAIQKAMPDMAGVSAEKVRDNPALRELLITWYLSGKQEQEDRAQQAAQTDPKFREQLRRAQAAIPEE